MKRLLEIRSYMLHAGTGARFHALINDQSVALLRAAGMGWVAGANRSGTRINIT